VIADFSPGNEYKRAVEKDDAAIENFVGLWRALAKHLASRDPESVFLEVMNEPVMTDSARWNVIQKKALAAMRKSAPRHTLLATSAEWSEIYRLELVEVVADRNVVYNVHYYDPVRFTHQGAPWVGDWVKGLRNAPYPSSPEAVAKVLDGLPDDAARTLMINYGKERWNSAKIDAIVAEGAAWAKKWCRPGNCPPAPTPNRTCKFSKHPAFQTILRSCELPLKFSGVPLEASRFIEPLGSSAQIILHPFAM